MIASSYVLDGSPLLTMQFTNFSTQPQNDVLRVLECVDIYCSQYQQLAELSGTYLTTKVMASATGYMKVIFTSDGSITSDGFTASWNSVSLIMFLGFVHPKTTFVCLLPCLI
jgi:ABC-type phosphate/phosphonate transport system ATPase subunit